MGEYCSQCGQKSAEVRVSVKDLARDFISEHIGFDTRVPATLWTLVRYPGKLTEDYLGGKRARYVLPLRLYLSASVLFFLLLTLPGVRSPMRNAIKVGAPDRAELDSALSAAKRDSARSAGNARSSFMARRAERFKDMTADERIKTVRDGFQHYLPDMIFAMLPVFALILYLLYIRSGRFYAENLIFALHFHAFVYAVLIIGLAIPSILEPIITIAILVYLYLAMRRVYAESRIKTFLKFAAVTVVYGACVIVASMGVLLAVFALV